MGARGPNFSTVAHFLVVSSPARLELTFVTLAFVDPRESIFSEDILNELNRTKLVQYKFDEKLPRFLPLSIRLQLQFRFSKKPPSGVGVTFNGSLFQGAKGPFKKVFADLLHSYCLGQALARPEIFHYRNYGRSFRAKLL